MHICSLHLYTYSQNELINGTLEIKHEDTKVNVNLDEADRKAIQDICVHAYLAEKEKIVEIIRSNSPAYVALEAPKDGIEEAEFTPAEF